MSNKIINKKWRKLTNKKSRNTLAGNVTKEWINTVSYRKKHDQRQNILNVCALFNKNKLDGIYMIIILNMLSCYNCNILRELLDRLKLNVNNYQLSSADKL